MSNLAAPNPAISDGAPPTPKKFIMRWLTTLTLTGCFLGIGIGVLCNHLAVSNDVVTILQFPGKLWVRALKLMVVPLIFSSMVVSTAGMGASGATNRMSKMALRFYLSTTFIACAEGIIIFNVFMALGAFHPLKAAPDGVNEGDPGQLVLNTTVNFGYDLVPDNLFAAFAETQLLGIMTFAICFGLALSVSKSPHRDLIVNLCEITFETIIDMIKVIILITPLGVGSLVAGSIAKSHDLASVVQNLGSLVGVVIFGQCCHVFGVYMLLYFGFTKKNPLRFYRGLPRMWVTAFGTSSSAATLSTTIKCCENLGVSKDSINYVLPIGCTVNMDGSALERPLVVLWIAYVGGHPVQFAGQIVVALIAALLSIGGSPIPSAGVSTLYVMVESAGVPSTPEVELLIGFALAIEWLLDSIRTTVNVTGDSVGCAIIDHLMLQTGPRPSRRRSSLGDTLGERDALPSITEKPLAGKPADARDETRIEPLEEAAV